MYWLLAIAALTVTSYEVIVKTLDGNTFQGSVASWDESNIELRVGNDSPRRISREELADISLSEASSQAASPSIEVLLTDGALPAKDLVWQEGRVQIFSPLGGVKWELPFESIRAVRFDLSDGRQSDAWRQLTERSRTSDWIVVHKKSRGALDYVEGVIENVSADSVAILLDNESIEVPREKVFGIVFYRRKTERPPQKKLQVLGPHGLSLSARDVRLKTSELEIKLLSGDKIGLAPEAVSKLVFFTDKIIYLTDFEPIVDSSRWDPYFDLPEDSSLLESWGAPRRNESFLGSRLQLVQRGEEGRPLIQDYERGLAMRSRSEESYQLPPGYRTLKAIVGMDPAANEGADALLVIEADGQSLGQWRLERSQPAQPIEVDVSGKRRLRLFVDFGSGTDTGDVVHLCEPRLIK